MTFLPVCIPTLNRYEHLCRCLESLSHCTWADQTEVFVALDYPPANQWDKYAPGWEKNRQFLRSCGDMGFKKLHIIEREENYGIWRPEHKGNLRYLIESIKEQYKQVIVSEDDNIFSPCFLEYMDKGYEKFKDDPSVYALCGYCHPYPIKYGDNTYFRENNDFSAWGVSTFRQKMIPVDYHWFRSQLTIRSIWNMRKHGRYRLARFLRLCEKPTEAVKYVDNDVSVIAALRGMYFVVPTISLVRNIGADGSGVNFTSSDDSVSQMLLNQEISTEKHFDFIGTGYEFLDENRNIFAHNSWGEISKWKLVKVIVKSIGKRIIRG